MFSKSQQTQIVEAIKQAELNTSGEIRLHVEPKCSSNPLLRAQQLFAQLGMQQTELKNGVLFYVAYTDKKFAIVGDSGIHAKVSDAFWDEERDLMQEHFRKGDFTSGICKAIERAGEKLKTYFPLQHNDRNELSNDISFGGDVHA